MGRKRKKREKPFNITVGVLVYGTVTVSVPKSMTIKQAIQWAKDNINEIPLPHNVDGVITSIDEENCDFDVD